MELNKNYKKMLKKNIKSKEFYDFIDNVKFDIWATLLLSKNKKIDNEIINKLTILFDDLDFLQQEIELKNKCNII